MDFDFKTQAGWQKFLAFALTLILELAAVFGVSQTSIDLIIKVAAILSPIVAMIGFFIVNQIAAVGKAKANQASQDAKIAMVEKLAITAPEVAIAIASPVSATPPIQPTPPISLVKDRIKVARQVYKSWDAAKGFLLGNLKGRFEEAIKRLATNNPNMGKIDAVRQAVLDVIGVKLTDEACAAIGQIPGFHAAVGANADIRIMADLLNVLDNTPELKYIKDDFTKTAERYAVKDIVDEANLRVVTGQGNATSKLALLEFSFQPWQIEKFLWPGGKYVKAWHSLTPEASTTYMYYDFDPYMFAGVDPVTLEDI